MCVKPVSEDELISGYIRTAGCWEPEIVNSVIRAVTSFPGAAFLGITYLLLFLSIERIKLFGQIILQST